jgi:thiamine pyrophosphokinase
MVAGGEPGSATFLRGFEWTGRYIVAVDRGLNTVSELGLTPDLFVGDGDSARGDVVAMLNPRRTRVVMLPVHKDVSDLEAAFDQLTVMGFSGPVVVLAGLGGRLDHLLFNLQLAVRYMTVFEDICFEDAQCMARPLAGVADLALASGQVVSLVPQTQQVQLTLEGFEYPLVHAVVAQGSTRTLSNVVRAPAQRVVVEQGTALMIVLGIRTNAET